MNRTLLRAGITLVLFFLALFMMEHFPFFTMAIFAAVLTYAGARSFLRRARQAKWVSKWTLMRSIRGVRKTFLASPEALAMYAACFCVASFAVCTLMVTQSQLVTAVFIPICGGLLCIATFLDWYARLNFVLSIPRIRQLAKVLVTFLAAATVFFSTILAKEITHEVAQADPSAMPEFVRLLATLIYPFALSAVLSATLSIVMLLQYVGLIFMLLGSTFANQMGNFLVSTLAKPIKSFGYRILNGRRPPQHRSVLDEFVDGTQHFFRPIGTGAIAALVLTAGLGVKSLMSNVPNHYMQMFLVMTEYRSPHLCENVPSTKHVAYLQDGYVSVATPLVQGYLFSIEKCHR